MNATELRVRMGELSEPPADSQPPYWDYWRHDLWQRVVDGEDPLEFPTWPSIYHTMLVNHWKEYIEIEFRDSSIRLKDLGAAIAAGPPKDYCVEDSNVVLPYSRNLIHQVYHLRQWETVTRRQVKNCKKIIEFGGGYGAMALVIRRLGFTGEYHIFDLPEFSLLQEFYLTNCDIDDVQYNNRRTRKKAGLLIACYSLSEMELDKRTKFLTRYKASSYLFLYSDKFAEYDNLTYFQTDVPTLLPDHQWEHIPIKHLPPCSWYSFGWQGRNCNE